MITGTITNTTAYGMSSFRWKGVIEVRICTRIIFSRAFSHLFLYYYSAYAHGCIPSKVYFSTDTTTWIYADVLVTCQSVSFVLGHFCKLRVVFCLSPFLLQLKCLCFRSSNVWVHVFYNTFRKYNLLLHNVMWLKSYCISLRSILEVVFALPVGTDLHTEPILHTETSTGIAEGTEFHTGLCKSFTDSITEETTESLILSFNGVIRLKFTRNSYRIPYSIPYRIFYRPLYRIP